jgi:hypothetical protein
VRQRPDGLNALTPSPIRSECSSGARAVAKRAAATREVTAREASADAAAAREATALAAAALEAAARATREAAVLATAARSAAATSRAVRAAAVRWSVQRVRQRPYARPSRQRGARLCTPSDDEEEQDGLDGDAVKKEEHDGAAKEGDETPFGEPKSYIG